MGLGTPRARTSSPGITGQATAPGTALPLIPRISYQVSLAEPGTGPESEHPSLVLWHMRDYEQQNLGPEAVTYAHGEAVAAIRYG